jgi:hypothetical protein
VRLNGFEEIENESGIGWSRNAPYLYGAAHQLMLIVDQ